MQPLLNIKFSVDDLKATTRRPVRFATQLAQGQLFNVSDLALIDVSRGAAILADIRASALWHDGSIKWINVLFTLVSPNGGDVQYELVKSIESPHQTTRESRFEQPYSYKIESHDDGLSLNAQLGTDIEELVSIGMMSLWVTDLKGKSHQVKLQLKDNLEPIPMLVEHMVLYGSINVGGRALSLELDLLNYQSLALLEVELTVHNSAAAEHANGLWDLGDSGSIHFQEIYLQFESEKISSVDVCTDMNSIHHSNLAQQLSIAQYSSGGVNRQSANHIRHDGKIGDLSLGYKIFTPYAVLEQGDRVAPIVVCDCATSSKVMSKLAFHIHHFWEEFPTEICINESKIRLSLFALIADASHELQAGEKKRRKVSCLSIPTLEESAWLQKQLAPPTITDGDLKTSDELFGRSLTLTTSFDKKLEQLLAEPEEYYSKREIIDEFGWRNFGDVFADHESLYVDIGKELLVSHYNNQYDILLGFGLQYLRTKNKYWFQLMNDLARHVVDIDVYNTDLDRAEYNHGLFWHTNHYVPAYTSTHRTFSIENFDASEPRSGSGGPAREHCYTAGLLLHYRLTGDQRSADAVMALAKWALVCHEGNGSLKSTLRSVVKHEARNIIRIVKSVPEPIHRYYFDRGTGNLVEACLDAFELSADRKWLLSAGNILLDTFSPDDDVDTRSLLDVEIRWSYTVFLQSAVRFLCLKLELSEYDSDSSQVHAAFVIYARWMLENEAPYLENESRLEFVNDTWVAQDVRKHTLFVSAAVFDKSLSNQYLEKASYFEDHIIRNLSASDTVAFTRIQALLLLNIGIGSAVSNIEPMLLPSSVSTRAKSSVLGETVEAVRRLMSVVF